MKAALSIAALAALWLALPTAVHADTPQVDPLSAALSGYLHDNQLPLVEARISTDKLGFQTLVLYGFCATPFGKMDAEAKARKFLDQEDIVIDNRILVRPQLLNPPGPDYPTAVAIAQPPIPAGPTDDEATPPADATAGETIAGIDAYQNQQQDDPLIGGPLMPAMPLLMLGMFSPVWGYPGAFIGAPILPMAPGYLYGYRYPGGYRYPVPGFAPRPFVPVGVGGPPIIGRTMPLPGQLPSNYVPPVPFGGGYRGPGGYHGFGGYHGVGGFGGYHGFGGFGGFHGGGFGHR